MKGSRGKGSPRCPQSGLLQQSGHTLQRQELLATACASCNNMPCQPLHTPAHTPHGDVTMCSTIRCAWFGSLSCYYSGVFACQRHQEVREQERRGCRKKGFEAHGSWLLWAQQYN